MSEPFLDREFSDYNEERTSRLEKRALSCVFCNIQFATPKELKRHLAACVEYQSVIEIAALKAQLAEAWKEAQSLRDGNNYIKQFVSAKEKCSAMYTPDEVYTEEQLSYWAEENGFIKPNPLMDDENAALKEQLAEARKAAEWQKITPENIPKVGDEAYSIYDGDFLEVHSCDLGSYSDWKNEGWSHFRPINPPTESEEQHG